MKIPSTHRKKKVKPVNSFSTLVISSIMQSAATALDNRLVK